jgi:hypothetical protein
MAEPPPSFTLCVRGESFELGEALSAAAESHVAAAFALLGELCAEASADVWIGRQTSISAGEAERCPAA